MDNDIQHPHNPNLTVLTPKTQLFPNEEAFKPIGDSAFDVFEMGGRLYLLIKSPNELLLQRLNETDKDGRSEENVIREVYDDNEDRWLYVNRANLLLAILPMTSPVTLLRVSPDGTRVLIFSESDDPIVWDLKNLEVAFRCAMIDPEDISFVGWVDEEQLTLTRSDNTIEGWRVDVRTRNATRTRTTNAPGRIIQISDDAKTLLMLSDSDDSDESEPVLQVLNIVTGEILVLGSTMDVPIKSVSFCGKTAAIAYYGGPGKMMVEFWNHIGIETVKKEVCVVEHSVYKIYLLRGSYVIEDLGDLIFYEYPGCDDSKYNQWFLPRYTNRYDSECYLAGSPVTCYGRSSMAVMTSNGLVVWTPDYKVSHFKEIHVGVPNLSDCERAKPSAPQPPIPPKAKKPTPAVTPPLGAARIGRAGGSLTVCGDCNKAPATVVNLPCWHVCCCSGCAVRQIKNRCVCRVCGVKVENRVI